MITTQLNFESFLNEKAFCQLQMDFLQYDEDYPNIKRIISTPEKNLSINGFVLFTYEDEDLTQYITSEIFFEKDFLIPSINKMGEYYFSALINKANEKDVYVEGSRDAFAQKYIALIRKYKKAISKVTFLKKSIIKLIIFQLTKIEDKLYYWIKIPFKDFKKKLHFNLLREDVIYFFYLLKKNGVIEDMKPKELGSIIDSICYYKKKGSRVYAPISMSRSPLSDYERDHSDSLEESIERLKKFFNDDFFNH